jgi:hypothetical protein
VHLEVLVLRPRSDRTLNYLAHGLDRFTLPDADAESVIVSGRMDRQGDVRRNPRFECLGFGRLKSFGVMDSVDHGQSRPRDQ